MLQFIYKHSVNKYWFHINSSSNLEKESVDVMPEYYNRFALAET